MHLLIAFGQKEINIKTFVNIFMFLVISSYLGLCGQSCEIVWIQNRLKKLVKVYRYLRGEQPDW